MKSSVFFFAGLLTVVLTITSCTQENPFTNGLPSLSKSRVPELIELNTQDEIVFFDEELDNPAFDLIGKCFNLELTSAITSKVAGATYLCVTDATYDEDDNLVLITESRFDLQEGSIFADLAFAFKTADTGSEVTVIEGESIIKGTKKYEGAVGEISFAGSFQETATNIGEVIGAFSINWQ